jgi:hypothetical protein
MSNCPAFQPLGDCFNLLLPDPKIHSFQKFAVRAGEGFAMTVVGGKRGGVQKGRYHDYIPMIHFVSGLSALLPLPCAHRHCEDAPASGGSVRSNLIHVKWSLSLEAKRKNHYEN